LDTRARRAGFVMSSLSENGCLQQIAANGVSIMSERDRDSTARLCSRHPLRVRRTRTKGGGLPRGSVYVGRPTDWGNPFRHELIDGSWWIVSCDNGRPIMKKETEADARAGAVRLYRAYLRNDGTQAGAIRDDGGAMIALRAKAELRGRKLACWCSLDVPCHADVLAEVANS